MALSHPLASDFPHEGSGRVPNTSGNVESHAGGSGSMSVLQLQTINAPEHLGLSSRTRFRAAATALIELTTPGTGRFVIDCSTLRSVDSTGLNTLVLLQRKAAESRVRIILRDADDELRSVLILTKLDDLFEFMNGPAR